MNKKSSWHWTLTFLLLGIIAGIPGLIIISSKTLVSIETLLNIIVISATLGFLLQIRLWLKKKISLEIFIFYNLFGIAPLVVLALGIINFSFKKEPELEYHLINNTLPAGYQDVLVEFADSAFMKDKTFRTFDWGEIEATELTPPLRAEYTLAEGCLGYPVIVNKRIIK